MQRSKNLTLRSIWVFLLLANEAMKTYKANPHFRYLLLAITILCPLTVIQYRPVQNSNMVNTPILNPGHQRSYPKY